MLPADCPRQQELPARTDGFIAGLRKDHGVGIKVPPFSKLNLRSAMVNSFTDHVNTAAAATPPHRALLSPPLQRIIRELTAAGFDELRLAHMAVLQFPGPDGVRPGTLAERAGMSKQAMNQLLLSLEASGYITRSAADDDGRSRVVRLTKRGRAAYDENRRHPSRDRAGMGGGVGPQAVCGSQDTAHASLAEPLGLVAYRTARIPRSPWVWAARLPCFSFRSLPGAR